MIDRSARTGEAGGDLDHEIYQGISLGPDYALNALSRRPRMTRPVINGIAPFFIVRNAAAAVGFYRDKLGFDVTFQEPENDPFFAIVCRGGAMVMVKAVEVDPLPQPRARFRGPMGCLHQCARS